MDNDRQEGKERPSAGHWTGEAHQHGCATPPAQLQQTQHAGLLSSQLSNQGRIQLAAAICLVLATASWSANLVPVVLLFGGYLLVGRGQQISRLATYTNDTYIAVALLTAAWFAIKRLALGGELFELALIGAAFLLGSRTRSPDASLAQQLRRAYALLCDTMPLDVVSSLLHAEGGHGEGLEHACLAHGSGRQLNRANTSLASFSSQAGVLPDLDRSSSASSSSSQPDSRSGHASSLKKYLPDDVVAEGAGVMAAVDAPLILTSGSGSAYAAETNGATDSGSGSGVGSGTSSGSGTSTESGDDTAAAAAAAASALIAGVPAGPTSQQHQQLHHHQNIPSPSRQRSAREILPTLGEEPGSGDMSLTVTAAGCITCVMPPSDASASGEADGAGRCAHNHNRSSHDGADDQGEDPELFFLHSRRSSVCGSPSDSEAAAQAASLLDRNTAGSSTRAFRRSATCGSAPAELDACSSMAGAEPRARLAYADARSGMAGVERAAVEREQSEADELSLFDRLSPVSKSGLLSRLFSFGALVTPTANAVANALTPSAANSPTFAARYKGGMRTSPSTGALSTLGFRLGGGGGGAFGGNSPLHAEPPLNGGSGWGWGSPGLGSMGTSPSSAFFRPSVDSMRDDSSNTRLSAGRSSNPAFAQWHDSVTLLFADIVGFSSICRDVDPPDVLCMLNELFTRLDNLCLRCPGLYKLETIGDAYIVASGLLEEDPDHADRMLMFALEMQQEARQVTVPSSLEPLQLRVGVHSGRVMSGVVGKLRKKYSVFGDAVCVASRMESTSEPGRVQVSATTRSLTRAQYRWTSREPIDVKGIGMMSTFFLEGLMPTSPTAAAAAAAAAAAGVATDVAVGGRVR